MGNLWHFYENLRIFAMIRDIFIIQSEISELLAKNVPDFGTYTRVSRALPTKTLNLATRKNTFLHLWHLTLKLTIFHRASSLISLMASAWA